MADITHILFDLGHVVLDWQPRRLYATLFEDAEELDFFLSEVCNMAWHTHHDAGASWEENAVPLIRKYPQYEMHIRAWGTRWLDMFEGYVPGTPELIEALEDRGHALFALSNIPSDGLAPLMSPFPVLGKFRDIVVSGDEKCVKPNPKIYHISLQRMGHPAPESVLFIDDRLENIKAAEVLGMRGHHFQGAAGLKSTLKDYNLL